MSKTQRKFSRRRFLLGGLGAAGALVVGWGLMPPRQRLDADPPLAIDGHIALNGWVLVAPDNRVTVMLAKSEMGQGVMTALPMLVAEELDVPLSSIELRQAPLLKIYGDTTMATDGLPFHPEDQGWLKRGLQWMTAKAMRELGLIVTGGSSSVKDCWLPMREAGAAARARLLEAAAREWKLPGAECRTEAGHVIHPSGRRASYGQLAEKAARIGAVDFRLKQRKDFRVIGLPTPRLDIAGKVNGSARFGLDLKLPGMLYASVAMCPVFGGRLVEANAAAVSGLRGVRQVISLRADRSGSPDAVAVVADTRWHALQALRRLEPHWDLGVAAQSSSDTVMMALASALESEAGSIYHRRGDVDALGGTTQVSAEYRAPFLAHAALEPVNCTVQFADGRLKLWVPTQVPSLVVATAARVAGLPESQVDLQVSLLGGGFGRRLDTDMVAQAVQIARELGGAPVQLLWSRTDDLQHDFYRPASIARLEGRLDERGRLLGWRSRSASGSAIHHLTGRAFGLPPTGPDKTTCEGLFDHPYEVPHQHVSHAIVDSPVPLGTWRSVGHSQNAFFKECFIDELALAADQDPLSFRRALLADHPRHRAVLDAAVRLAGEPEPGRALGMALHQSFGSIVAQVAEVSVDGLRIQVHRVSCAIDCGIAVNPEGVRQQMMSGVAFGLSAALHEQVTVRDGRVEQSNFHDYRLLRMAEMPEVEVMILQGGDHPEGVGEPGTPPIAPAVANAVFKLTGQRLRSLPLRLS